MTVRARERSTEPGLQATLARCARCAWRLTWSRARCACAPAPRGGSHGVARSTLVEQPERHNETEIDRGIRPSLRLERRGAFRGFERELHFLGRDVAQNLEEIIRVESDVEGIASK